MIHFFFDKKEKERAELALEAIVNPFIVKTEKCLIFLGGGSRVLKAFSGRNRCNRHSIRYKMYINVLYINWIFIANIFGGDRKSVYKWVNAMYIV